MVVEIRLYKRNDMDLVALADAGYSIPAMMQEAVIAYANGSPLHFLIDEITPFDKNGKQTVHTRFRIPDSEQNAVFLLKNIKSGCRNSFCKILLRNALIQQNLSGFFARNELLHLQSANMQNVNLSAMQNVKLCSSYKSTKQFSFAGKTFKQAPAAPMVSIPYGTPQFQIPMGTSGQMYAQPVPGYAPYGGISTPAFQGVLQGIPSAYPVPQSSEPSAATQVIEQPAPHKERSHKKDVSVTAGEVKERDTLSSGASVEGVSHSHQHSADDPHEDDISKNNTDTDGPAFGFADDPKLMKLFETF